MMKVLMGAGADANKQTKDGLTALMVAKLWKSKNEKVKSGRCGRQQTVSAFVHFVCVWWYVRM